MDTGLDISKALEYVLISPPLAAGEAVSKALEYVEHDVQPGMAGSKALVEILHNLQPSMAISKFVQYLLLAPPTPPEYEQGHTLVYVRDLMEGRRGWFYDLYRPSIVNHYGEEGSEIHSILCGGPDGGVYQLTGDSDNNFDVPCTVRTSCRDQSNPRIQKLYGDIMLDCDTDGVHVSAIPKLDNDTVVSLTSTVITTTRTQVPVPVDTQWKIAKNISLDLEWNMRGSRPQFYIWEPRYTEAGANLYAYSWDTSYLSHGMPGYFYHGYLYLAHNSTANLTFDITDEVGTVVTSVTIPHSVGEDQKDFIRLPITKGKLFKYTLSSTVQFRVYGEESELLVKPWGLSTEWTRVVLFKDVQGGA